MDCGRLFYTIRCFKNSENAFAPCRKVPFYKRPTLFIVDTSKVQKLFTIDRFHCARLDTRVIRDLSWSFNENYKSVKS